MDFYDDPPVDIRDATAKVKHLCTMQGMESIFNQLREHKINHKDLESAVFVSATSSIRRVPLCYLGLLMQN